MKIISLLMAVLLVPVLVICHCCPAFAHASDELKIEKAACHSCCPGSEITRESAVIEKYVSNVSHESSLIAIAVGHNQLMSRVVEAKNSPVSNQSPPLDLISLSSVLRI